MSDRKNRELWHKMYPDLANKEWFIAQLKAGKSCARISKELHCDRKTVRKAARRHGIRFPYSEVNNPQLKAALDKIPK